MVSITYGFILELVIVTSTFKKTFLKAVLNLIFKNISQNITKNGQNYSEITVLRDKYCINNKIISVPGYAKKVKLETEA